MNDIIRIRKIDGAQILDTMNCAAISERFFNRSRAWFIQRLNNNIVNGKPVSFSTEELLKLRTSLKVLASEITRFTSNIPNLPTDMSIKVYVIDDPASIEFFENDDIDGFKEYLTEDDTIIFPEAECFDTEAEALAFCSGIGYGTNERGPVERYPLRSCESTDLPFIEAIEAY
ncbi:MULTISPECIES: DUF5053 domain-containing protein [Muribaculaceae]|jgi:hypothetical protein|uniref:DUF5053 domain-containing protein n=2 Tax=Bacteroidales TaxID=171549 RepID=UPI000EF58E17|nr:MULTISPECIES: DUF5053 domain-containing protein [Muribaculaceae]MCX4335268.1 DUF5053 domain-containing protein [Bacteroidales bacterium]RLT76746.1 DUF5053 domain-containing protein [bacterium J10(2018)]ROT05901.1 DUF5053 domain-containing protein [Muribaculaceae bacterium Isolate-104 (HZI)]